MGRLIHHGPGIRACRASSKGADLTTSHGIMNGGILLDVFDTMYLSVAVYGVAIALSILAMVVRQPATTVGKHAQQSVSPVWLVVPALVAAGLLSFGRGDLLAITVGGFTFPVLFVAQIAVSAWLLWQYLRFPWLVLPLAVVLGWIQWSFFLTATLS